jgi:hypothetical protein
MVLGISLLYEKFISTRRAMNVALSALEPCAEFVQLQTIERTQQGTPNQFPPRH